MAAWGQTNEQMLHWVHLSLSQAGMAAAMVRFSRAVVPGGMKPPGVNTLHRTRGEGGGPIHTKCNEMVRFSRAAVPGGMKPPRGK